jgi:aryl-alcohol dehydrogenase-like predicted oxidoreductase
MAPAKETAPKLFTFGAMSLGSDLEQLDGHIRIARMAMDAGVWFHASPTYHRGFTYMVLRMAFDDAGYRPPMIVKIRCGSARLLRFEVEDALRRLDLERIEVAQLVFTESGPTPLVEDLNSGGPMAETCAELREQGKVARFCPQCSVSTSGALLPLARDGHFDGFVFYLNPLQRDVSDELWQLIQEREMPIWALRTVAGALGVPERRERRRAEQPDDPKVARADQVAPLVGQAGCPDWTEFCLRFAAGVPNLRTTIGGTADAAHLHRFLEAAAVAQPLPEQITRELLSRPR